MTIRSVPPRAGLFANQHSVLAELLEALRPHWRSDRALPRRIEALLRGDRRFGSRDRRLYREILYTAIRILPWIEHRPADEAIALAASLCSEMPATTAFKARYADPERLAGLNPDELLPSWLRPECPDAFAPAERDALLQRAPLWIRLQTTEAESVRGELIAMGADMVPSGVLPAAWRVNGEIDLTRTGAFLRGQFEIQDLGSQLILASADPDPGERWLDACAGAGGKSLQLAGLLGPKGQVTAHDPRPAALAELETRAARARLRQIVLAAKPAGEFDGVLVDAPCSGTGTWRRAPHLKWVTTPEEIKAAAQRQLEILQQFSRHVRPGGRLIYATCSLCHSENEAVVQRFLEHNTEFAAESPRRPFDYPPGPSGLSLLPARHDTDGFFVSALRRQAG